MANIFETIEIEAIPNVENHHMLGEDILIDGEEVLTVDVALLNGSKVGDNSDITKIKQECSESFIVMLPDGTFSLLQVVDNILGLPRDCTVIQNAHENNPNNNHVSVLPSQIPCSVDGCNKQFVSMSQLKAHQRKHNGMSPYECEFCQKKFSTGYALKTHKRTHTGEKPYVCSEVTCKKKFKTSGDFQKHVRTHTGERPFKCEVCTKAFTTSNIRKVHMRVHTGEKPYECTHEGCKRKFSSATNFRNHTRIHTGEKPYVCSVENCQKRFTEYSSLYKHYSVHSQRKIYACSICNRQYRQLSTLHVHFNTTHKDHGNLNTEDYMYEEIDDKASRVSYLRLKSCSTQTKNIENETSLSTIILTSDDCPEGHFLNNKISPPSCPSVEDSCSFNTAKEESSKTIINFEPLKAVTCGSEAILVLAVPAAEDNLELSSTSNFDLEKEANRFQA